ncbi:MAG: YjjG family noncanonical pyrimidine nucleotidase [Lachnospiraceae bacterium]|nr:YjjG family noncanonical pyrimidine nucleotidase [Lachnospiraceae bacterium]
MYTTILWDLDNTLLDFTASERYAFNTCMQNAGVTPTDDLLAAYSQINLSFWKMLERGEITKEALLGQRFVSFFEAVGITGVDTDKFKNTYQKLLGSVYYYLDDSFELCQRLHQTHKQYIVTNGVAATQRSKLRLSRLATVMDGCFISEELGYEKPSPQFFEKSFAQIPGFKKEEAILVGDSLTSDMLGANNAGIDCCWYNPAALPAPASIRVNYTVRRLSELETILDRKK